MSGSPISDAGYASRTPSPWISDDCAKFGDTTAADGHPSEPLLAPSGHAAAAAATAADDSLVSTSSVELDSAPTSPTPLGGRRAAPTPLASAGSRLTHSVRQSITSAIALNIPSLNAGAMHQGSNPGRRAAPAQLHPLKTGLANLAAPGTSVRSAPAPPPAKSGSFWDSSTYWLSLYFFFNLGLTIYNKVALVSFPFPWTLTCIHSLSAALGSYGAFRRGYFERSGSLGRRETAILVAFSSLYTINIAVSNLSLNLVSVPMHQVVRSTTPLFTILISVCLFHKGYLFETYLSLAPVVVGVCFATYGDYSFTNWGLFLTLLGAFLAAVKGIATNRILVGRLKMHPLDLLLRMSPLAFGQCLVFSLVSGELAEVYERTFVTGTLTRGQWTSLLVNGAIAFGLNVVSFTANKKTGALTMSVAANVKQVLTIVLAVLIFNLTINGVNMFGIVMTIVGGAWYSYVEFKSKAQSASAAKLTLPTHSPLLTPNGGEIGDAFASYEKQRSPLPPPHDNPFEREQEQTLRKSAAASHPDKPSADGAVFHRKANSLAAFRYPVAVSAPSSQS